MKEIISKIENLFKRKNQLFSIHTYEKPIIHPGRDWMRMLTVFFSWAFISAVGALYLYFQVQSGNIWGGTQEENTTTYTINDKSLKNVLSYFGQKESMFNSELSVPKDPSIK